MAKHHVIHPVQHDNKHYGRGSTIELSEKDAQPLVDSGYIKVSEETEADGTKIPALDKMTKQQLVDFAQVNHNLTLNLSLSKAELIAAINNAAAAPVTDQASN